MRRQRARRARMLRVGNGWQSVMMSESQNRPPVSARRARQRLRHTAQPLTKSLGSPAVPHHPRGLKRTHVWCRRRCSRTGTGLRRHEHLGRDAGSPALRGKQVAAAQPARRPSWTRSERRAAGATHDRSHWGMQTRSRNSLDSVGPLDLCRVERIHGPVLRRRRTGDRLGPRGRVVVQAELADPRVSAANQATVAARPVA